MKLRNKKTGEIVSLEGELLFDEKVMLLKQYNSLAEINEEWEDYEEPKEYWFITGDGLVFERNEETYPEDATARKQIGNYFETKEEAEKVVEKLKAWKRLKDKGFKFYTYTALGCGEIHFMLDWEDIDEKQLKQDLDLLFGGEE